MTLTPTGNKVVCEWINFAAETKIAMPESFEAPDHASYRVIAVGEGRMLDNGTIVPITNVKVGDEVVCHPGASVKIEPRRLYGDRRLICVPADGILMKITREESEKVPAPQLHIVGANGTN